MPRLSFSNTSFRFDSTKITWDATQYDVPPPEPEDGVKIIARPLPKQTLIARPLRRGPL